jgi:bifunctional DNA-binding transcriptional regulator/antitoxin component of YhaV-PrlF toxin-antitoxin module
MFFNGKLDRMISRLTFRAMVRTQITSKGQTTVPGFIRKQWKTRAVIWESCPDGSARVRPLPDVMSLYGAASSPLPRDPDEKEKGREAWGK